MSPLLHQRSLQRQRGRPLRSRGGLLAVVGVLAMLASLGLGQAVTAGGRTHRDEAVARWVVLHVGAGGDLFAKVVAHVISPTNGGLLLLVVAAVLARRTRRWAPLLVASAAMVACTVAVLGQKFWFARPYQSGNLVHGGAYPSGHTATAMVVGLTLVLLLSGRRPWAAATGIAGALAVTVVLGVSMVVAKYHWATDIGGGLLTGLAVCCVTVSVAHVCRLPTRG